MSQQQQQLHQAPAPAQDPPVGDLASLPAGRDLAAEKAAEVKSDAAAAASSSSRFTVKKRTALSRPAPAGPEYETLILKAAANNPLQDVDYPSVSHYVPDLSVLFFVLNMMDGLMAATKRWMDNSAGWVPPISQAYVAVLALFQIIRAQHAAGYSTPDMVVFLSVFEQIFPLSELWIPGPLVSAFRALSAFRPDENDLFGGVTCALPNAPGWTAARYHIPDHGLGPLIPNLAFIFSRFHDVATLAVSGITDVAWELQTNGLFHIESLCGHAITHNLAAAPGIRFALHGSRDVWRRAHAHRNVLGLPARLNHDTAVINSWTAYLFFENNQHHWFANVSAVMAKYCQFFHGSRPISDLNPVNSASGALKLRYLPASTIHAHLVVTNARGTRDNHEHGNDNEVLHQTLVHQARVVFDCDLAVRDVPDAHIYAAMTWNFNCYVDNAEQTAQRQGPFWNLGPNVRSRRNAEVLPGLNAVIMREYHSDTRIPADKQ